MRFYVGHLLCNSLETAQECARGKLFFNKDIPGTWKCESMNFFTRGKFKGFPREVYIKDEKGTFTKICFVPKKGSFYGFYGSTEDRFYKKWYSNIIGLRFKEKMNPESRPSAEAKETKIEKIKTLLELLDTYTNVITKGRIDHIKFTLQMQIRDFEYEEKFQSCVSEVESHINDLFKQINEKKIY